MTATHDTRLPDIPGLDGTRARAGPGDAALPGPADVPLADRRCVHAATGRPAALLARSRDRHCGRADRARRRRPATACAPGGGPRHDVTADELRALVEHTSVYAGFPRALNALDVVNEVLAETGDATPIPVRTLALSDHTTQFAQRRRHWPGRRPAARARPHVAHVGARHPPARARAPRSCVRPSWARRGVATRPHQRT